MNWQIDNLNIHSSYCTRRRRLFAWSNTPQLQENHKKQHCIGDDKIDLDVIAYCFIVVTNSTPATQKDEMINDNYHFFAMAISVRLEIYITDILCISLLRCSPFPFQSLHNQFSQYLFNFHPEVDFSRLLCLVVCFFAISFTSRFSSPTYLCLCLLAINCMHFYRWLFVYLFVWQGCTHPDVCPAHSWGLEGKD